MTALSIGKQLGAFEIIELLGSGGMGEVYRARDTRLGRQVAIKVLGVLAEADETQVVRFEREARFLASLDHPNIAGIYDFQEDGGTKFLIMQLVEGPTLSEQLKKGPLPLKEALLVFAQIAEALDAAHKRDIIHRDLKPANLKITPDARVKVLDFGLAKLASSDPSSHDFDGLSSGIDTLGATQEGQILGTPAYMSPEQARGLSVDKRADIWSFGCIFYETLTGKRPFTGATISDLVASVLREQPDWTALPREVPPNICTLIQRCLEKERDLRLADISEARLEIDRALTTLSTAGAYASPAPGTTSSTESVLKVMLFTELVDSVSLKKRIGDRAGAELISRHNEVFRRCLGRTNGTEVENAGDGFFSIFERASDALNCAMEFQREIAAMEGPEPLQVRAGIHMGEIVRLARPSREGGSAKYVGLAIDAASRITSLAEPRQILLTRAAFDAARQQVPATPRGEAIQWLAHGPYVIRGLEEPVDIFEAGVASFSPLCPPTGSERAKRLVRADEEETLGWRPATDLPIPGRENWALQSRLGEGGFGEVWLAEHRKTHEKRVFKFCFQADRVRALKHEVVLFRLLKETLGDREDITRILDWKFDEPPYFIESEFTNGGSLVDWAAARGGIEAVPLEQRLEFAAQVAEALAAAHSVGVLHKDLKPANILIEDGSAERPPRAVLTDFGIGLIMDRGLLREKGITATGLGFTQTMFGKKETTGAGTRLYMAPEVIEGKAATTQSDIYSLGIVLYQLVTGNFGQALAPGWERDVADPLIREDVAACVQGKPRERLAGAAALAERLRSLDRRRAAVEADLRTREQAAQARRLAEEARRRRRQYALFSAAGFLLTLAIGVFAFQASRRARAETLLRQEAESARTQEQAARVLAERAQALAEELREKAEYAQYVSNVQLATMRLNQGEKDLAREALASTPERARNWEWGYLANVAWPEDLEMQGGEGTDVDLRQPAATLWKGAAARVSTVMAGHTAFVVAMDFSDDETRMVSGSGDRTAKLWDTESGQALQTFTGNSTILGVALSHDGQRVATSELVQTVTLWDAGTGEKLFAFDGSGEAIQALAFSADDSMLASHALSGTIRVWDTRSGKLLGSIEDLPAGRASGIALDGAGGVSAAWSESAIKTWDLKSGEVKFTSASLEDPGMKLAGFVPELTLAASRRPDGRVTLWDPSNGQARASFDPGRNSASTPRLDISPDGSAVATLSDDNVVRIWDARTGELLTSLPDFQIPDLASFRFSRDGCHLAVPDKNGRVLLLAPDREQRGSRDILAAHDDLVYLLRYSPDGKTLLSASYDATIALWDPATRRRRVTLRGHEAEPGFAAFSPDGRMVLTGSWDRTCRLWDARTGQALLNRPIGLPAVQFGGGPRGPVFSVFAGNTPYRLFSPDGRRFIALTERPDTAAVFETATGKELFRVADHSGTSLYPYLLSPDGRHILTVAYPSGIGRIWDASDGRELFQLKGHTAILTHADFSPDGSRIATTSVDGTTRIWETATGRDLWTLAGHRIYSNNAQFSPSGRLIVTSSHDQTAKVWEVETGREIATLVGHKRDVVNAAVSPDETRILTTGQDDTLKVWDLQGHELVTIPCESRIYHAIWSPDGTQVAAALGDGTIRFWRAALWSELQRVADADAPLETRMVQWRKF